MTRDDEFVVLAAEYAEAHRTTVNGTPVTHTMLTRTPLLGLHRRMFAAMGGADTMAARLADGTVVTATVRGHNPAVFEVSVEPVTLTPAG